MFKRLLAGLSRTREALVTGMRSLLGRGRLDHETLDELEELLYTSDLGPAATRLVEEIREAFRKGRLTEKQDVEPFLRRRVREMLGAAPRVELGRPPHVVLVVGVNGSGKTTSIAKLARLHGAEGRRVMLAACDTFRAAAVDQLTIWADRLDVPIVTGKDKGDPSGVAFDAAARASAEGVDVLVVDTAGRLHTQKNLMAELEKIARVLGKRIDGAPHETLLVLDGTTGQNAIVQARQFQQAVPVTGILVSKLDGTARGGAVVTIREQLGLPVRFVGVGERADDLERFDPDQFVDALFSAD